MMILYFQEFVLKAHFLFTEITKDHQICVAAPRTLLFNIKKCNQNNANNIYKYIK